MRPFLYLYKMTIPEIHQCFLQCKTINTDSRTITPGQLFIALRGENFDGNQYAQKAIEAGAAYAIIDNPNYQLAGKTIFVDDCLTTLQQLATYHREYLNIPILALTGSNGKTTTKELINQVLSQKYQTTATQGNLNNHIGVPLTLLSMDTYTQFGIVEMGANHPGEIKNLCEIANPDFGYITNFGKAHLEGFGSLEGVINAKSELYHFLNKKNKKVFVNTDDPNQYKQAKGIEQITFGSNSDNQVQVVKSNQSFPYLSVYHNNTVINTQLIGNYNFSNVAAAITIGIHFEVPLEDIKKAIENYIPQNNRSQIIHKKTNTIILDAYNANPSSMEAAIHNFELLHASKKVIFLGDMFELGSSSTVEHQNIVDLLQKCTFDQIYLLGNHFSKTILATANIQQFQNFEQFQSQFIPSLHNTHILIKGSRSMKMERILDLL